MLKLQVKDDIYIRTAPTTVDVDNKKEASQNRT